MLILPSADIFAVHIPQGKFQRKFNPIPSKQLSARLQTLGYCLSVYPPPYINPIAIHRSLWGDHKYIYTRIYIYVHKYRNNRAWHGGAAPKSLPLLRFKEGKSSPSLAACSRAALLSNRKNLLSYRHVIATSDIHENNAVSERSVVLDTASNFL